MCSLGCDSPVTRASNCNSRCTPGWNWSTEYPFKLTEPTTDALSPAFAAPTAPNGGRVDSALTEVREASGGNVSERLANTVDQETSVPMAVATSRSRVAI